MIAERRKVRLFIEGKRKFKSTFQEESPSVKSSSNRRRTGTGWGTIRLGASHESSAASSRNLAAVCGIGGAGRTQ
jgi:hypothetical protein